ncbi:MAG: arginine--tRNA ligase [Bacteroidetes bacterium]|nr:MAG: arginine--tRNA ligase [Bacteroidota bacterium]
MNQYLTERVAAALRSAGVDNAPSPSFEKPRQAEHGDLTTTIALTAAKLAKIPPRQLAQKIVENLHLDTSLVEKVEIAGPGFINFHFSIEFFKTSLGEILRADKNFGKHDIAKGKPTQVEFVSANPTGPLTVGHGRGAVYGDTISRLLEWTGHNVTREYYFNNAGRQMRVLGDSVRLRYLQELGDAIEFPEDYYQGEYIRDIARGLVERHGDSLRNEPAEGMFKQQAETEIFDDIKKSLKRLGVVHEVFSNENELYETGKVTEVIEELRAKNLAYDLEGAVWFKATQFGSEKDKVIVKSTGEPTYRLPDIAYHREKLNRGFELVIDVLGADHIATYPDVLAGLTALGYDSSKIKVLIHQFVTIIQNNEVVKMSTRKANFVTLDELMDEVGADVVRYFFIMRSVDSHLNFDLGLAKKQSDENPVYYLQYAHARIASIIRHAEDIGVDRNIPANLSLLSTSEELAVMKKLLEFPGMVESCAATFEPHRLADYLQDVAGVFHRFYHEHRVVTEDLPLTAARMSLCLATKIVLGNGFEILGITAPERM